MMLESKTLNMHGHANKQGNPVDIRWGIEKEFNYDCFFSLLLMHRDLTSLAYAIGADALSLCFLLNQWVYPLWFKRLAYSNFYPIHMVYFISARVFSTSVVYFIMMTLCLIWNFFFPWIKPRLLYCVFQTFHTKPRSLIYNLCVVHHGLWAF